MRPHARVPFYLIDKHRDFINSFRPNLEIYLGGDTLDRYSAGQIVERIKSALEYEPQFTIHGPFMDLSPGAHDMRVRKLTAERFEQTFNVAGLLRTKAVVLHSGYEKWRFDHQPDAWLANSLPTWRAAAKMAEEAGTMLAVENIFEDEPGNLTALLGELGSSAVGICFDTGHYNLFGRAAGLEAWLDAIGEHIIEMHLHDNRGDRDSHMAVGEGDFDFNLLFGRLAGRKIIHTIEATSPEDTIKSAQRIETYLKSFSA